jgi:ATP-dependent DNA helicase PIF1
MRPLLNALGSQERPKSSSRGPPKGKKKIAAPNDDARDATAIEEVTAAGPSPKEVLKQMVARNRTYAPSRKQSQKQSRKQQSAPQSFSRGSAEAAAALGLLQPTIEQARTVYNPFSGRVVPASSPQVQALEQIGIAPVAGVMNVLYPAVFNAFAADVRNRRASIPPAWSGRMRTQISTIVLNPALDDPAAATAQLLLDMDMARKSAKLAIGAIGTASDEELREEVEAEANLNAGQRRVLELALEGYSMYIGGPAGTGKTVVLRAIRGALKRKGVALGVTAMTGLAAAHLSGVTFHSFFGINRFNEVTGTKVLVTVDALIIDEVSMMDRFLFENFDRVLRKLRGRPESLFGGVQVIMCGDFMQLEPVAGTEVTPDGRHLSADFIFDSPLFLNHLLHVALTEQVRQAAHVLFGRGLQTLRRGVWPTSFSGMIEMLPQDIDLRLAAVAPSRSSNVTTDDPQQKERPILLLAKNVDVRIANEARLAELPGDEVKLLPCPQAPTVTGHWTSCAVLDDLQRVHHGTMMSDDDALRFRQAVVDHLRAQLDSEHAVNLVRAYVVFYPFLDGWILRVRLPTDFDDATRAAFRALFDTMCAKDIGRLSEGRITLVDIRDSADGLQTPAVDAALTRVLEIHPVAQPLTLKVGCEVMLRRNLTRGLINGSVGVVTGFVPATAENIAPAFQKLPQVHALIDAYAAQQRYVHGVALPLLPVVEFKGFGDGKAIPVPPCAFAAGGDVLTHYYEIATLCIPLVPAYAFTIHKVQGMTLRGAVHIALGKLWKCNHIVYVALSRVRTPDQLVLSGFKPDLVHVNVSAIHFDAGIPAAVSFDAQALAEAKSTVPHADWANPDGHVQLRVPAVPNRDWSTYVSTPPNKYQQHRRDGKSSATVSHHADGMSSEEADARADLDHLMDAGE